MPQCSSWWRQYSTGTAARAAPLGRDSKKSKRPQGQVEVTADLSICFPWLLALLALLPLWGYIMLRRQGRRQTAGSALCSLSLVRQTRTWRAYAAHAPERCPAGIHGADHRSGTGSPPQLGPG